MYLRHKRPPCPEPLPSLEYLLESKPPRKNKANQVCSGAHCSNRRRWMTSLLALFLSTLGYGILMHIQANDNNDNGDDENGTNGNICPAPETNSTAWKYYKDLVDINSNIAAKAGNVTKFSPPPISRAIKGISSPSGAVKIPHRLVFTHKVNIFNCSSSASADTPPEVYMLAENAKRTVNIYRQIWADLEVVFLDDDDCKKAIKVTEPRLLPYFDRLDGRIKADLCRAADLFLHGGYYYDVDILVVNPYVASDDLSFVTVKCWGFPGEGFFQAFLATSPRNEIIGKSLETMLGQLDGSRKRNFNLGTKALQEAYDEVEKENGKKNKGSHLLTEVHMTNGKVSDRYKELPKQSTPDGYGEKCLFAGDWLCNYVVMDEESDSIHFYSRLIGTGFGCGRRDHETCPKK